MAWGADAFTAGWNVGKRRLEGYETRGYGTKGQGARQISSGALFCRINAAFRVASEHRINAAAENLAARSTGPIRLVMTGGYSLG
jgi:hypothetical protein